ncbi:hypothetical protein BDR06DRAFT_956179 [Suillus hirtellus]|nr:hypothetical protein BDR06DRAFT_956179 [Suillus hirtellus]
MHRGAHRKLLQQILIMYANKVHLSFEIATRVGQKMQTSHFVAIEKAWRYSAEILEHGSTLWRCRC